MTWTIYNNDKAWGFLSEVEKDKFRAHEGDITQYDFPSVDWLKISYWTPIIDHVYRAVMEPTPAVDADQTAKLNIANARIAELEAALRDAADALEFANDLLGPHTSQILGRQGALRRAIAALNPTTEEAP
jgi:hypothetical protein